MTKRISVSVPDDLHEMMEKWKQSFNFSNICQNAIRGEIERKEDFQKRLKGDEEEMEQIIERLRNEKAESDQNYLEDGKRAGLSWAKISHYDDVTAVLKDGLEWEDTREDLIEKCALDQYLFDYYGHAPYGYLVQGIMDMPSQWMDGFYQGVQEFWDVVGPKLK